VRPGDGWAVVRGDHEAHLEELHGEELKNKFKHLATEPINFTQVMCNSNHKELMNKVNADYVVKLLY
jgi:hypothetical protein